MTNRAKRRLASKAVSHTADLGRGMPCTSANRVSPVDVVPAGSSGPDSIRSGTAVLRSSPGSANWIKPRRQTTPRGANRAARVRNPLDRNTKSVAYLISRSAYYGIGNEMTKSEETPPLDVLTAALGGRRINTLLWALWLLAGVITNYAMTMVSAEVVRGKTKAIFAICVFGFILYGVMLVRGVITPERRARLLYKQSHLPHTSLPIRFFVWLIAVLALGAALSPFYFR